MGSRLRTLYMHQGITYLLSGNFTSCRSCEGYLLCISSINGKSVVYVIFFAVCFCHFIPVLYYLYNRIFVFWGSDALENGSRLLVGFNIRNSLFVGRLCA